MNKLLDEYIDSLHDSKKSRNTLEAYLRDIKKYLIFIEERKETISQTSLITIMDYVQHLQKNHKALSSINRNLVVVRNFYKYLNKRGIVNLNPFLSYDLPKLEKNMPKIISVEEVDKLLDAPDISIHRGARDKAMMELMYATGMKVSELLNLIVIDLDFKLGFVRCKGSKDKERIIPVGSKALLSLKKYLNIRDDYNPYKYNFLFLNLRGFQMTRQGFWKIVKGYAKEIGIKSHIDLFTLRHSFAVHMLANGADLKSLQELLGYSNLSATECYTVTSKRSSLLEVYKKAHPRA